MKDKLREFERLALQQFQFAVSKTLKGEGELIHYYPEKIKELLEQCRVAALEFGPGYPISTPHLDQLIRDAGLADKAVDAGYNLKPIPNDCFGLSEQAAEHWHSVGVWLRRESPPEDQQDEE